jgi:hypothetical protein
MTVVSLAKGIYVLSPRSGISARADIDRVGSGVVEIIVDKAGAGLETGVDDSPEVAQVTRVKAPGRMKRR